MGLLFRFHSQNQNTMRQSNVPGQYTQGDGIEDNFPIMIIVAIIMIIATIPVIYLIITK
jgi:hypothetical protein